MAKETTQEAGAAAQVRRIGVVEESDSGGGQQWAQQHEVAFRCGV